MQRFLIILPVFSIGVSSCLLLWEQMRVDPFVEGFGHQEGEQIEVNKLFPFKKMMEDVRLCTHLP